jgi:prepilin-type N-terminal cleavage/methylation domain-containing protein
MKSQTSRPGVTLVEILVVLAIVTMLASVTTIVVRRLDMRAKEEALKNTLSLLDGALGEYHEATGEFPIQSVVATRPDQALAHNQQVMNVLQAEAASRDILNKIDASYRKNLYPTAKGSSTPLDAVPEVYDPWGTAIDYVCLKGDAFPLLRSAGPDGIFGTADDRTNR